jgi:hypothetical protein
VWGAAALAPFVWRASRRVAGLELVLAGVAFAVTFALDALTRWSGPAPLLGQGVAPVLLCIAFACVASGLAVLRSRATTVLQLAPQSPDTASLLDAE